jgi:tRNA(Ile)-lysidine synthase
MRRAMGSSATDRALTPDSDSAARFAAALNAIWAEGMAEGVKLGLAVSGGPDSTALLLLAAAALPGRIAAATVDHGLRTESAREAADVGTLCQRLDVPHDVLAVEVAPGNIQAEARRARYAALGKWVDEHGLAALATGHHADDQAETLLLRLNRASGVAGLAGTRARGVVPETVIPLLRPLLGWRRGELAGIVAAAGVDPALDPSNSDDRFDRARLRKVLADVDWLDVAAIAESAGHLADADAALDWAAQREWRECVTASGLATIYRPKAPRAVALRVLLRIVMELDGEAPRGGAAARLYDSLMMRRPASIGDLVVRPMPEGWSFTRAPKRRSNQAD